MAIDEAQIERLLEQSLLRRRSKQKGDIPYSYSDISCVRTNSVRGQEESLTEGEGRFREEKHQEDRSDRKGKGGSLQLNHNISGGNKNNNSVFFDKNREREIPKMDNCNDDSTLSNINSVQSGYFDYIEPSDDGQVYFNVGQIVTTKRSDHQRNEDLFRVKNDKRPAANQMAYSIGQPFPERSGYLEKSEDFSCQRETGSDNQIDSLSQRERIALYKEERKREMAYISMQFGLDLTTCGDCSGNSDVGDVKKTRVDNSSDSFKDSIRADDSQKMVSSCERTESTSGDIPIEKPKPSPNVSVSDGMAKEDENGYPWGHEMDGNHSSNYNKSNIQFDRKTRKGVRSSTHEALKVNVVIRSPSNVTIGYDNNCTRTRRMSLTSYSGSKPVRKSSMEEITGDKKMAISQFKTGRKSVVEADQMHGDNRNAATVKEKDGATEPKVKETKSKRIGLTSPVPDGFKSFTELHRHKKRQMATSINNSLQSSLTNRRHGSSNDADAVEVVSKQSAPHTTMNNSTKSRTKVEDIVGSVKRHSFHMPIKSSGTFIKTMTKQPSPRRITNRDSKRGFMKSSMPSDFSDVNARRRRERSNTMPHLTGGPLKGKLCGAGTPQAPSSKPHECFGDSKPRRDNMEGVRSHGDVKVVKSEGADNTSNISFSLATLEGDDSDILQEDDHFPDDKETTNGKDGLCNLTRKSENDECQKVKENPVPVVGEEYEEHNSSVQDNKSDSICNGNKRSLPNNSVVVTQHTRLVGDQKRSSIAEGISPLNALSRSHKHRIIKRKEEAAIAKFQKYITQRKQHTFVATSSRSDISIDTPDIRSLDTSAVRLSDSDTSDSPSGFVSKTDDSKALFFHSSHDEDMYHIVAKDYNSSFKSCGDKRKGTQFGALWEGQKTVRKSPGCVDLIRHRGVDDNSERQDEKFEDHVPLPESVRRCSFTPMVCVPLLYDHQTRASSNDKSGLEISTSNENIRDLSPAHQTTSGKFTADLSVDDSKWAPRDSVASNVVVQSNYEKIHYSYEDKLKTDDCAKCLTSNPGATRDDYRDSHSKTDFQRIDRSWTESSVLMQSINERSCSSEKVGVEKLKVNAIIRDFNPKFGASAGGKSQSERSSQSDNKRQSKLKSVSGALLMFENEMTDDSGRCSSIEKPRVNDFIQEFSTSYSISGKLELDPSKMDSQRATDTDVKTFEKCVPFAIHAKVTDFMGLETNAITDAEKDCRTAFSNRSNNTFCENSLSESFPVVSNSVYDKSQETLENNTLSCAKTMEKEPRSEQIEDNPPLDEANSFGALNRNKRQLGSQNVRERFEKRDDAGISSISERQPPDVTSNRSLKRDEDTDSRTIIAQVECNDVKQEQEMISSSDKQKHTDNDSPRIQDNQKHTDNDSPRIQDNQKHTDNDSPRIQDNQKHTDNDSPRIQDKQKHADNDSLRIQDKQKHADNDSPRSHERIKFDESRNTGVEYTNTQSKLSPKNGKSCEALPNKKHLSSEYSSQEKPLVDLDIAFNDSPLLSNTSSSTVTVIMKTETSTPFQDSPTPVAQPATDSGFLTQEETKEDTSFLSLEDHADLKCVDHSPSKHSSLDPATKTLEFKQLQNNKVVNKTSQTNVLNAIHSDFPQQSQSSCTSKENNSPFPSVSYSIISIPETAQIDNSNVRNPQNVKNAFSIVHTTVSLSPAAFCDPKQNGGMKSDDGNDVETNVNHVDNEVTYQEPDRLKRINMYQVSPLRVRIAEPLDGFTEENLPGKTPPRQKLIENQFKFKSPQANVGENDKGGVRKSSEVKYQKGSPRCHKKVKTRVASKIAEKIKGFLNKSKGTVGQGHPFCASPDSSPDLKPTISMSRFSTCSINSTDETQIWSKSKKTFDSLRNKIIREESSRDVKAVINVFEKQGQCEKTNCDSVSLLTFETKAEKNDSGNSPLMKRTPSTGSLSTRKAGDSKTGGVDDGRKEKRRVLENGDNNNSFLAKGKWDRRKTDVESAAALGLIRERKDHPAENTEAKAESPDSNTPDHERLFLIKENESPRTPSRRAGFEPSACPARSSKVDYEFGTSDWMIGGHCNQFCEPEVSFDSYHLPYRLKKPDSQCDEDLVSECSETSQFDSNLHGFKSNEHNLSPEHRYPVMNELERKNRGELSYCPETRGQENTVQDSRPSHGSDKHSGISVKSRARKIADEMICNLDVSQDSFNMLFIENAMYLKEDDAFAAPGPYGRRTSLGHLKKPGIKLRSEDFGRDQQRR